MLFFFSGGRRLTSWNCDWISAVCSSDLSGADISQFEKNRHNAQASEEYSRRSAAQRALLADYPKPTIACIRGFCLGGGMQVAMMSDMRIAAAHSQFGIPAAKLGIAYGYD